MAGRSLSLVRLGALVLLGALGCRAAHEPEPRAALASERAASPAPAGASAAGAAATDAATTAQVAPFAPAEPAAPSIRVRVDPRVELLCVLARLAGFDEYSRPHDYAYASDAAQRFAPFAEHDAVRTLRRLRFTNGVSHDALISMAVHLGELPELAERGTWDGAGRSLERRWPLAEARRFREQARRFAAESDFAGFLADNAAFYAETEQRFGALLARRDVVGWLDGFFGVPAGMEFYASPGLLTGGSAYGSTAHESGAKLVHQVIGVTGSDEYGLPLFDDGALGTVAHEYCHAFANPLVEAHAAELEGPCRRIFPHVELVMKRQAYGNWQIMMSESLVRAACTRFWPAGPEREAAIRYESEQCGFRWTRELSDALGEYEADRARFPGLEAFLPRMVAVMEEWAERLPQLAAQREEQRRFWQARTPEPPAELEAEVERGLAQVLARIERTLAAEPAATDPPDPVVRVRAALREMRFERDVQVTVLDARGDFVFHAMDLAGSAYGHLDVQGEPVYRRLNESPEQAGLTRNFDFVAEDGAAARANAIAWARLAQPAWLVCVEGHAWQAR